MKLIEKYRHSPFRHEMSDVVWLLALKGLNYLAPILVLPYLMVTLGAEKFGYIGFSLSVCQILMLIVDFGFDLSATKRIALHKNSPRTIDMIYSDTILAKGLLLVVTLVLMSVVAGIPRFAIYRETLVVMYLMVVGQAFSFVWLLQGMGQIRVVSIINTICKLSILPLTFVFVHTSGDYLRAAFIQSMVYVSSSVLTYAYIRKKDLASWDGTTLRRAYGSLKDSFPIFFSNAATSIYTISISFFLGWFGTAVEVGRYSAVDRLVRALTYMILFSVLQAFYPRIVQMGKENAAMAIRYVRRVLVCVVVGMSVLAGVLFVLSPYAEVFLGGEYAGTTTLFRIQSCVPLFVGAGGVYAQLVLLAMGSDTDKRRYRNVYTLAGLMAFACIFLLVPLWKAVGASWTVVAVEIFVAVGMAWNARRCMRRAGGINKQKNG